MSVETRAAWRCDECAREHTHVIDRHAYQPTAHLPDGWRTVVLPSDSAYLDPARSVHELQLQLRDSRVHLVILCGDCAGRTERALRAALPTLYVRLDGDSSDDIPF